MKQAANLERLEHLRKLRIRLAHDSFYEFCRLEDPDFYDAVYLKTFCDLLQAFYEGRIRRVISTTAEDNWGWRLNGEGQEICKRLIVSMPPRHGKTRTVCLFEAWVLGRDQNNRIICGSYSDDSAADMSRAVRDKIMEETASKWRVTFSDVFPNVRLKTGDSSVKRWALEGQHFNYLASGVGGRATGKGCNLLVIDDPIKNAEEAYNSAIQKATYSWITDTMLSRMEGDAMFMNVMTRWPGGDPVEEMKNSKNGHLYFNFVMPAHTGNGVMLNPKILNYKTYLERKEDTDSNVFSANYDQEILTPKNALYEKFRVYSSMPINAFGEVDYDAAICYIDTADGGDDYLCAIAGKDIKGLIYVDGIVYEKGAADVTVEDVADMIVQTKTREIMVESNSGGKAFARNLEEALRRRRYTMAVIEWSHQSANKESRLLHNAASVQKKVIYPLDWENIWPEYSKAMRTYVRLGRNKHDDAPDATTGLVEFSENRGVILA